MYDDEVYGGLTARTSQVELEPAIPVEMKAGQVAIFSSLLLHMSGPNKTSNHYRHGFVPQYHVPDVILKKNNQSIVKIKRRKDGGRWHEELFSVRFQREA